MVETAIFDLDGTLLYTLGDLADSMNKALKTLGYPVHETDKYRYFVGNGVNELCRGVLPEGHKDDETVSRLLEVYDKIYSANQMNTTVPYPGISEMLGRLREKGVRLCVLSNKPDANTAEIIKHFFGGIFDVVMGKRAEFPRKPDPSAVLHILGETGTYPTNAVFIGDSGTDMKTAVNAGITPVGVLWGFRDEKELIGNGAVRLASTAAELADIILSL